MDSRADNTNGGDSMTARKVLVVGIALFMMLGAMSFVAGDQGRDSANADESPEPMAGSTPRTVLVEVFTATWCPPCTQADPALSRIADEYPHDEAVVLDWHPTSSLIGSPVTTPRAQYYGWGYLPTVTVDGGGKFPAGDLWTVGASSPDSAYDGYTLDITTRSSQNTYLKINVTTSLFSENVEVTARIEATDPVTDVNLFTYFVIYEDDLYANDGPTLNSYHRHVVRDYTIEPLSISNGEVKFSTKQFTMQPDWDPQRFGAAVFVQTDIVSGSWPYGSTTHVNRDVIQAAEQDFAHNEILLVNDMEDNLWDREEESFQKLLANIDLSFDTWNTRTMFDTGTNDYITRPTFDDMKDYSTVIWFTGSSLSTLDASERQNLSQFLDSTGNLFIIGENIGAELNVTDQAFLNGYLHANFSADNSGNSQVRGLGGDPISAPWAGSSLSISATSPDVINPIDNFADTTFTYFPAGTNASVRAQHDADSRVLYFGFNVFELEPLVGTASSFRSLLMYNSLMWLNPAPQGPVLTDVKFNPGYNDVNITWDRSPDDGIGADDVVRYEIYSSQDFSGPYAYLSGVPADGSATYSWLDVNADQELYTLFYKVFAHDGMTRTGIAETPVKFYQGVNAGTNLISMPLQPLDTSVPMALEMVNYDMVWAYEAFDTSDPWKSYSNAKPYYGDLTDLNNTMGFWVNTQTSSSLLMAGLVPVCTDVPLYVGWNLVSYPALSVEVVNNALSGIT
jgi:thiol-disulfide isomerase/thioredoxin